jgi:hypothetical protein
MSAPALALDRGRVLLAGCALIYLERALAAAEPLPAGAVPRSYGLASTAIVEPGVVLAAIAPGEAVWLGFQAVDPNSPVVLRVRIEGARPLDAVSGEPWRDTLGEDVRGRLVCPPDYCLPGLRRPDGYVPFGHGDLTVLVYEPVRDEASIRIVDPKTFSDLAGREPESLDPDSAYEGWGLP